MLPCQQVGEEESLILEKNKQMPPATKVKLTYKLSRKETQIASSSTFGDLKVCCREVPMYCHY